MGLLDWLFGSKGEASEVDAVYNYDNVSGFSGEQQRQAAERFDALLKEAVILKKVDIDKAASLLRQAYEIDQKYDLRVDTTKLLRLPKYLQNAGKSTEALNEMGRLTAYGTSSSRSSLFHFNAHMSDCHEAYAQIKKKQKVCAEVLLADDVLAKVYRLNSFVYLHEDDNKKNVEVGFKPESIKANSNVMHKYEFILENLGEHKALRKCVEEDFKKMPIKNIGVQKYYDSASLYRA